MKLNLFAIILAKKKVGNCWGRMVHFNFKQGLFQAKGEILQYIGEDGKEYVPYDYNFEEDIVPAINNLIPGNETLPIQRELKNINGC